MQNKMAEEITKLAGMSSIPMQVPATLVTRVGDLLQAYRKLTQQHGEVLATLELNLHRSHIRGVDDKATAALFEFIKKWQSKFAALPSPDELEKVT